MDSNPNQSQSDPKTVQDQRTKKTDRLPVVELRPVIRKTNTVLMTFQDKAPEKKPEPQLVMDPNQNKDQMKPVQAVWKGNDLLEVTTNRARAISGSVDGVKKIGGLGLGRMVVRGFMCLMRWCGCLFGRKPRFIQVQDTLNAKGHHFTDVEFIDRWALVEFGVTCPRCEKIVAAPWQFERIVETNTGEGIFCPGCGALLLACPTTEKSEHLLPYTKDLEKFSRQRHQLSPYSSEEASKIRMQTAMERADPLAVVQKEVEKEQQKAGQPPVQVLSD